MANFTPWSLYPRERTPVPIELEDVWASELLWAFRRRYEYVSPSRSVVTNKTLESVVENAPHIVFLLFTIMHDA